MYHYVQITGGEESWQPVPQSKLAEFAATRSPMFVTVLAVSALAEDLSTKEEQDKLTYLGPLYFDWDGEDIDDVQPNVVKFINRLINEYDVDPGYLRLYATGGRGFHLEIPAEVFTDKVPKGGWQYLPTIYKEIAMELAVDTLDLRVYSTRRGRQWRQPNVQRPNGKYKVPMTWEELQNLNTAGYEALTSHKRELTVKEPKYALNLAMLFDKMLQKVSGAVAKRKKAKVSRVTFREDMPTLQMLCAGIGIKEGTGFNTIALQISILAHQLGWDEAKMVEQCAGLISNHQSDGHRYNTESKRRADLVRMHRYMADNPCYEASVGAVKSILFHPAPDLDGIHVTREELEKTVEETEDKTGTKSEEPGEYDGLTGVDVNRWGVYAQTEDGKRRICALSFGKVEMLKSLDTGTISAMEADVLVNGRVHTRQALELDTFNSVQSFNKFCVRHGHAFQGSEANLRGLYMKTVESAKKSGAEYYVTAREGLDVISIPHHENEELRKPFLVWSDGQGVVLDPRVEGTGVNLRFHGYPDPRGQYQVDLGSAPSLTAAMDDAELSARLESALDGMFNCQRADVISKLVGWMAACFYRMMFHKAYGKFPLLHINAPAGTGKSDMSKASLGMFYWNQTPLILSPSSTVFALNYAASGSVSAPLMIDEYKPHAMPDHVKEKLKLMFRDAYNCREQQRGGGSRDSDDYRVMHKTQLCAPMMFVAEAMEEESAVMERVVLVTMVKPHPTEHSRNFLKFRQWEANSNMLALIGKYIAATNVRMYSVEKLKEEFEAIYNEARDRFMLTGAETDLSPAEITEKSSTKERTVYNYSVAAFGLSKFSAIVEACFPGRFTERLEELEAAVFMRMEDVSTTTQPEWLKVLNHFSDMMEQQDGIRLEKGRDWAQVNYGGTTALELNLRVCYMKYRAYCRNAAIKPLYASEVSFMHGMNDCSALIRGSVQGTLRVPGGAHFFDLAALERMGYRNAI